MTLLPTRPYLEGAYAPVFDEITAADMTVEGEVPRDVRGVYVRNGPNPRFEPRGRHHWFDGDGMLHAMAFEDGVATYRNRWIRTDGFERDLQAGRALWTGLMEPTADNPSGAPYKDTSNTDVIVHRGQLLTLWYICGAAHHVDPKSLETRGVARFGESRPLRLSAHSKVDPETGELLWFDYGPRPPFMRYGVVGPDGDLKHSTEVELPGPRLPHDMAVTRNYSILMDLPLFYSQEAMKRRKWVVQYHREMPARFGVLPRHAAGDQIRWFEAEPCYLYHVVNAWEEDDEIVMVGCRCTEPIPSPDPADGPLGRMLANLRLRAKLHRWRFNLQTGQTQEEPLDDLSAEFPVIDDRRLGRRSRVSYHVRVPAERTLLFDGLVKYDTDTGSRQELGFGPGRFGSEAAFAPRDGSTSEDDGYLMTFVDDRAADRSELWIVDAADFTAGPVAKIRIPQRVPLGFHACWAPLPT